MIGYTLSHYKILGEIGRGGMGIVYHGVDLKLNRDVALKILPPDLVANSERKSRFVQEAQAAAALDHPNIATIFEIDEAEGVTFIAMELIRGEKIRDGLTRAPPSLSRLLELATEVADGLAHAHDRGIVHRDLKPANIMIAENGHAKIIDFGLAKLIEPVQWKASEVETPFRAETDPGRLVGTASYMSPEQARGQGVDHRSDIFTFGIVLYELLAGEPPFDGTSAVEVLNAILKDPTPRLPALGSEVPDGIASDLQRVVDKCLSKDPAERYQTIKDVLVDLRAAHRGLDSGAPLSGKRGAAGPTFGAKLRRRGSMLGAGALILLALGVIGQRMGWRGAWSPESTPEPNRVVVAVFENQTGDPAMEPLGRMAAGWVTQGIAETRTVEVVPAMVALPAHREAVAGGTLADRDRLHALAEKTDAATVVSGDYYLMGETLQFQAEIVDAVKGDLIHSLPAIAGPQADPMQVIEALRQQVMGALATSFDPVFPADQVSHLPRFEGYREYIAGVDLFVTDAPRAIAHFVEAGRLDPDFMPPKIWLAVALGDQGRYEESEALVRLLDENREQLTQYERYVLDWIKANYEGKPEEALRFIRSAHDMAPSGPSQYAVARWELLLNRPRKAIDIFSEADVEALLASGYIESTLTLQYRTRAYHLLGDYERELEDARRGRQRFPGVLYMYADEARALAALGRIDDLMRLIEDALAQSPELGFPGDVMLEAAEELGAHGYEESSVEVANRAVDWYRNNSAETEGRAWSLINLYNNLAHALELARRWPEAQAEYEKLWAERPDQIRFLGILGTLAVRRGDSEEARRISLELGSVEGLPPRVRGVPTYYRACIGAMLGDRDRAIALLKESFAQGFLAVAHAPYVPILSLHRDSRWDSLRQDPEFRELLSPKPQP